MKLSFNDFDLDYTAKVLYKINAAVAKDFDKWQDFRNYMVGTAYSVLSDGSIDNVSTYGFEMSAGGVHDGIRYVTVAVCAFTVATFLNMR